VPVAGWDVSTRETNLGYIRRTGTARHRAARQRPGVSAVPAAPVACDQAGLARLLAGMLAPVQP
jgi:hypothetical protein